MSEDVGTYALTIYQGGTFARSFAWTDDEDPPAGIDLTGCHIRARIFAENVATPALTLTDEAGDFTIADQGVPGNEGEFVMTISDERTGALFWAKGSWRLDILHPDGTVSPLVQGTVTVTPRTGKTA